MNKNKNKAQEAHEGIRICHLEKEVNMKNSGSNRLYKLIYNNTLMVWLMQNMTKKYIMNCDNNYNLYIMINFVYLKVGK